MHFAVHQITYQCLLFPFHEHVCLACWGCVQGLRIPQAEMQEGGPGGEGGGRGILHEATGPFLKQDAALRIPSVHGARY